MEREREGWREKESRKERERESGRERETSSGNNVAWAQLGHDLTTQRWEQGMMGNGARLGGPMRGGRWETLPLS